MCRSMTKLFNFKVEVSEDHIKDKMDSLKFVRGLDKDDYHTYEVIADDLLANQRSALAARIFNFMKNIYPEA